MQKPITVDTFFLEPNIVAQAPVLMYFRPSLSNAPVESFLGNFTLRMNENGGAVFDGDKLIASIGRFDSLAVHADYRSRGIATELVYQMIVHNPDHLPAKKAVRTAWGARAYASAYNRFKPPVAPAPVDPPAPAPVAPAPVDPPAPAPVVDPPAPAPVVDPPAPAPVVDPPAPAPVVDPPAPAPVAPPAQSRIS